MEKERVNVLIGQQQFCCATAIAAATAAGVNHERLVPDLDYRYDKRHLCERIGKHGVAFSFNLERIGHSIAF